MLYSGISRCLGETYCKMSLSSSSDDNLSQQPEARGVEDDSCNCLCLFTLSFCITTLLVGFVLLGCVPLYSWAEVLALSNSVLLLVRWVALGGLSQVNMQLLSSSRKVRLSQTAEALPPVSQQLLMLSPSASQVLPNTQRLCFMCFTYFTHADRRCVIAARALAGLQSGADTYEQLKVQLVASSVIGACPQGITMKNRHCFVVAILFLMAIMGSIARPV